MKKVWLQQCTSSPVTETDKYHLNYACVWKRLFNQAHNNLRFTMGLEIYSLILWVVLRSSQSVWTGSRRVTLVGLKIYQYFYALTSGLHFVFYVRHRAEQMLAHRIRGMSYSLFNAQQYTTHILLRWINTCLYPPKTFLRLTDLS